MKLTLRKEEGKTVGWSFEAETKEESLMLGSIRNIEFFSMGDQCVQYDGMSEDAENKNHVKSIRYATKEQVKKDRDGYHQRLLEKYPKD